ncbi:branched-chain amino acid ABC transporter, ATP-binding protein [Paramagnetospirillum caucaseum]|uniref:Branched-chain amino acid ABC transporter, ATP-binding protein n=1 Tax=Paramagnetospirillum caucaseum TaxID=1244869 RepID=M3A6Q2_9PROT|nr:ABC transporter ATP-binding protein [Paramagnetospirillum caucaseum]EME68149.1 branched-chain amino acid ABC transporter, ATP-binding protein [Paramagnetospirillum caucaseum]
MLRLEGVTAGYGHTVILEGVDLSLPPGGLLAVLGRNGVGKSTLMKTIVGQTRLRQGEIRFGSEAVSGLPSYRRSRMGIGYVPQTRDVFPSLTVEENLRIAARPGKWTIERVFELFPNLAARRGNKGTEISGGEQQMLSIGRALMGNPSLLLLDEPMEGLAPVIVEQLLESFRMLRQDGDLAIILVEQYVNLALDFSPTTIVLDRGRVVFSGESERLRRDQSLMADLLGAGGQSKAKH